MSFKVPRELSDAIVDKNLVIFTGAGISIKEGLPSWQDIVLRVLEEKSDYIDKSDSFLNALKSEIMTPLEVLDSIGNP